MRRWIAALSLPLVVFGGCSGGSSGVTMRGQEFVPKTHRATAGDPITFTNDSDEAHTVTAREDGLLSADYFASGGFANERAARSDLGGSLIEPGGTYEATVEQPGTYEYVCLPHEKQGMTGTIIVER